MSVRLYVGNLPQSFDSKELESQLASIGEGIRFKAVLDRETGTCRGFGFANINDEKVADAVIEQLNGKDFGGNALRVERSERRDNNAGGGRRGDGQLEGKELAYEAGGEGQAGQGGEEDGEMSHDVTVALKTKPPRFPRDSFVISSGRL